MVLAPWYRSPSSSSVSVAHRRSFLKTIILASGAVFSASLESCTRKPSEIRPVRSSSRRTYDGQKFATAHAYLRDGAPLPPPDLTYRTDVIVVGAGPSGLMAAIDLESAGRGVIVLDSEPRAGGAAVSADILGGSVPLGSVYFVESTEEVRRMLSYAAIEPVPCPDDGYDFGEGEVVRNLWSDATLRRVIRNESDRDGMMRFRDDLLALGDALPVYPLKTADATQRNQLDQPVDKWLAQYRSPTLRTIIESYSRSSMGGNISRTNVYCLQNFYVSEFGPEFGGGRQTFPGGMARLTQGVASKLKDVRTNMLVARVGQGAEGVWVDAVDDQGRVHKIVAADVIMAVPKFQIPRLLTDCSPQRAAACRSLEYAPYMTLHVASSKPLVERDIYDTWNLRSEFETDVVNPSAVPSTSYSKNICSLFVPMEQWMRGQLQNEELFARRAAEIVDRFLSTRTDEQRASVETVYCWAWGHSIVVPTPGSHSEAALAASMGEGRIVFAHTDNDAAPALENALWHGAEAARTVLAR